jgi:hypothetical protein
MKSLEEIYIANGQDPALASKSGALEYDKKFGCMVWTPAQLLAEPEVKRTVLNIQIIITANPQGFLAGMLA